MVELVTTSDPILGVLFYYQPILQLLTLLYHTIQKTLILTIFY